MTKLEKIYFGSVVVLLLVVAILIFYLAHYRVWIKFLIIGLTTLGLLAVFVVGSNEVLDFILPAKVKEKVGFYVIRWRSKEFDDFVGWDLIQLKNDSLRLLQLNDSYNNAITDYSFAVLPIAKCFEGILKKLLVKVGVIEEKQLLENPELSISGYFNPVGNSAIFNALTDRARDKAIPYLIYSTYQECRNQILHYDPYRDNRLRNLADAHFYYRRIEDAIFKAYDTFKNSQ